MKIAIISFTDNGLKLSTLIQNLLISHDISTFHKPKPLKKAIKSIFKKFDGLIFIGATGICVRLISPYIKSKQSDPCVLVMDELARFVIPILSGHLGGGNELCDDICKVIECTPVITTATDINGKMAVDVFAKKNNLYITDFENAKIISAEILKGNIGIVSDFTILNVPSEVKIDDFTLDVGICISLDKLKKPFNTTLNLLPKNVVIGVGCKRNTAFEIFENRVLSVLAKNKIDINSVSELCSIDLKQDELCIIKFSEKYSIPFKTYTKEELMQAEGQFSSSEFVRNITGVDCVCERAAILSADELIYKKDGQDGVTIALALKEWSGNFEY